MPTHDEVRFAWRGDESGRKVPRALLMRRAATVALAASLTMGQMPLVAWAEEAPAATTAAQGEVPTEPVVTSGTTDGAASTASTEPFDSSGNTGDAADQAGAETAGPAATEPAAPTPEASTTAETAAETATLSNTTEELSAPDAAIEDAGADDPAEDFAVSVKVTGVTEHEAGEPFSTETWLPLTEVTVEADAEATAWDVFAQALDEAGFTYVVEGWYCPFSITDPEGRTLESTSTEPYCYWSFMVNGDYASVGAADYVLQPGDSIELVYVDGSGEALPEGDVTTNPDAEHPDVPSDWNGFGNGGGGAVVEGVQTPTENATEAWKDSLLTDEERADMASLAASDPLIIGNKIYVVSSSAVYGTEPPYTATKSLARLTVLDAKTGAREREVTLARSLDSVCRPVYADGILVIPLAEGYVQAVSASTLETLWLVDGTAGTQSISSLTVADGYVYVATADALGADYVATSGTVRRVNLHTGAVAGTMQNETAGYYWAGGIMQGGRYVVGDDAGVVHVFTADLTQEVSRVELSAGVRSTLVAQDGYVYAVSKDGVLHKLVIGADGTIARVGSVAFAASSTSTPTLCGGKAYVGGSTASYTGALAVIDLSSMTVETSVESYVDAAGAETPLPGDVKSVPLVSVQATGTYAYFTCNNMPGGLYCYKLGNAQASMLYTPATADQNYSMTSAFAGPDGTLYYINDSGNLFALRAAAPSTPGDQGDADGQGGTDAEQGQGGQGQQGSGQTSGQGGTGSKVPAAHAPLTQASAAQDQTAEEDGADADDTAAADDAEKDADLKPEPRTTAAGAEDGAAAEASEDEAVNPLAVGGIIAGVAGLIAAVSCAWWFGRRKGDA